MTRPERARGTQAVRRAGKPSQREGARTHGCGLSVLPPDRGTQCSADRIRLGLDQIEGATGRQCTSARRLQYRGRIRQGSRVDYSFGPSGFSSHREDFLRNFPPACGRPGTAPGSTIAQAPATSWSYSWLAAKIRHSAIFPGRYLKSSVNRSFS
ncbi:MAG: hypothetical protein ACE5JO_00625 [Candidatus Binatia bacterium]